jgi:hypothetical protein
MVPRVDGTGDRCREIHTRWTINVYWGSEGIHANVGSQDKEERQKLRDDHGSR